jgi:hypothetical protein
MGACLGNKFAASLRQALRNKKSIRTHKTENQVSKSGLPDGIF